MKQNRELKNKPTYIWSVNLTKKLRIYNGEKTVSSINGVGKN